MFVLIWLFCKDFGEHLIFYLKQTQRQVLMWRSQGEMYRETKLCISISLHFLTTFQFKLLLDFTTYFSNLTYPHYF